MTGVEVKPDPSAARPHGEEAKAAGLDPAMLAKLDAQMQGHCAAKHVSGVVGLISKGGKIGYFEAFGFRDIEGGKAMPRDAIFRLQSMTKPIVAVAALVNEPAHRSLTLAATSLCPALLAQVGMMPGARNCSLID
jgi:CubicO group peptidase (beta-lactamase class C family)